MKKLLFGAAALLLMSACSGSNGTKTDNQDMDSVNTIDSVAPAADSTTVKERPQLDAPQQDTVAQAEKKVDPEVAKYDSMLDNYESLIKKCWSMSKKGLSINDQELADVWMEAGDVASKLDKANKKLTPEQQSRLKKLDKDYKNFCLTQPS